LRKCECRAQTLVVVVNCKLLLIASFGAAIACLLTPPRSANAVCMVSIAGSVNCDANTTTTETTNQNGTQSASSDRQQFFDKKNALIGTVQPGVTVDGFGLELTQGAAAHLPVTMDNEGLVTAAQVRAVTLEGNGGTISYFGNGSAINTAGIWAGLLVDNVAGNVSIATGRGTIRGATGINASATGPGALTIATGSGAVHGVAAEGILAQTETGPLTVIVGKGGVTSVGGNAPAIDLTSTNGNISITANGDVGATGEPPDTPHGIYGQTVHDIRGIQITSNGRGNITVDGSGTIYGQAGRAIYALEGPHALGGILVTGSGNTISGDYGSAIRAQIENPADASDVIVDRSGNVSASQATVPMSAIHAITAGSGNIIVAGGVGARISNPSFFGINATAYGAASSGSISVSTAQASILQAASTGILADNDASTVPAAAHSSISVTTNGTINAGAVPNPVGYFVKYGFSAGGSGVEIVPAGILAGYDGGPVFGSASGKYSSCGVFGCTTLTPNPNVNGTVSVVNNASINAAGDGIFAFNFGKGNVSVASSAPISVAGATSQNGIEAFSAKAGNISVTTAADVTGGNGSGIQTTSAGTGTTTINVLAGTTQGATSGVNAASGSGRIQINNSGTIQDLSGQPGSLAVATSGPGNAALNNNAGGVVTGIVAMTGTGTNSFANAGIWNTLGVNGFGDSSVNNTGTINVFGPTTFSGLTTLTSGGTLNLAAGSTVGTLTVPHNLSLQSGALYVVALAPPASSAINVAGTASLAGAVQAVLLPGAYSKNESFTILQAAGGLGGTTFSGFSNPGFTGTLTYTPTTVLLSLTANLDPFTANQQNVASALNTYFNSGGTLPANFVSPLFSLTGANLANALTQISGEVAADAERGAFQMMDQFLNLMLDPFVDGRLGGGFGGGRAIGFAAEQQANLPPETALAYAGVLKAPPAPFEQRWTSWGASYGGGNWSNGNPATGSSNVAAQTYGVVAGLDYHYSPDTIFGFALGGGGTNWGLASGGTGRSDAFQTGVYGITRSGPAYLAAALAFTNHWMTTNRGALGDALTANFDAQSYGARLEGGYRYAVLPALGFAPYAALQAQDFHTPSYSETDVTGGGFGLSYAAMNATDVRTELGSRFDAPTLIAGVPLVLRGRLAWAHDFVSDPSLSAAFESLPGSSFVVNGAPMPQNSALTSAGAELFVTPRLTLLVKFDGEFSPGSQTYAGSGALRYSW
jgi:uncharacterized protein with beta-barrel porin domain